MNRKFKELQKKYETICAVCDRLHETLERRNKALIQGKALVDKLMGVAVENERLTQRIAELEAILEGAKPPKDGEIKA